MCLAGAMVASLYRIHNVLFSDDTSSRNPDPVSTYVPWIMTVRDVFVNSCQGSVDHTDGLTHRDQY